MKKRYLPFTYLPIDFDAARAFLDQKAREGWAFTKGGGVLCGIFTPTERTDLRYHTEPAYGKPDPARQALYRDAGWEYVARQWLLDVYASAPGAVPAPIHSDALVALDDQGRVLRRTLLCLLPALGVLLFMLVFWLFPWGDEEYLLFTYRSFFSSLHLLMALLVVLSVLVFAGVLFTLLHWLRARRVLARTGNPPTPSFRAARARSHLLTAAILLFGLFYAAFLLLGLTGFDTVERLDDAAPLPMVRVADLFPAQEEGAFLDVERRSSPFAQSYTYVNYFNGGYVLSHYYDCGILPIGGLVASALRREETAAEPPMGHIHGTVDMVPAGLGFDAAWVGTDPAEGVHCLILRQGNVVARVETTADLSSPAVLEVVRQRLGLEGSP